MSSHPLIFPDVKEYRVERTMSHLSSILLTLAKAQAKGASSRSSNRDHDESLQGIAPMPAGNQHLEVCVRCGGRHRESNGTSNETWALQLSERADTALERFGRLGIVKDIDEAIEYGSQLLSLTPNGHEGKPSRSATLGTIFLRRFMSIGDLSDLNQAVEYLTQAVLLTQDEDMLKADWLKSLGVTYLHRFHQLYELADLNKAIEYTTQSSLLTPDEHPNKLDLLLNLGYAHSSRFERRGELADLNKAVEYETHAVLLTPDGHPSKCSLLMNLGVSYRFRCERLGELADVNKAIDYQTQAVLLAPDGDPDTPALLLNIGASYGCRFERLGDISDLNKAIEYETQAVLLIPDGHPHKPLALKNLGISYQSRFERLGDLADLNKAIEHHTKVVLLSPEGHPDKPCQFNSLGNSYRTRFEQLGELADLNKAIICNTQAVHLAPDGHLRKSCWLNNLGNCYSSRFGRLGDLADANKAIEYGTQALTLTPDGHPEKLIRFYNVGQSYHSRFGYTGNHSDLNLARSAFQNGAQLTLTLPMLQIMCAREWAQCSLLLGFSPKSAYNRCMELIPNLAWLGSTIDHRYTLLTKLNDLATEAAAWAISIEAFDLALEWLEQGRSVVWNQILQLRTPFDDLFSVDPALAQDLKDTASKLEAAGSCQHSPLSDTTPSYPEKDIQQHHQIAGQWEQLLEQARTIPGFERFLRPRQAKELMLSATNGPVVVLNVYSRRCDALIIFPGCEDIIHLPLSRSLPAKLGETCVQLQSLIGHRGNRNGGFKRSERVPKSGDTFKSILAACWSNACQLLVGRRRDRKGGFKRSEPVPNPEDKFKSILATCWLDIVQPVLDLLACKHNVPFDEMPHVTWCTTGALSFLPLHAAGLYDGSRPNALDLIISSYTPTLSALLTTGTPGTSLHSGLLAVGQAQTRGFCPLPNTVHELAAIEEHAGGTHFQKLAGSGATVDAVLEGMERCSWVHLACHATQNLESPTQSAFHLDDGPLTLQTITKRSFVNKGLAFLSACQTATGDEKLADEAIHLAAGMLMAGYPSVIATMWSIQDEDGPKIAEAVYADLLKDGKMDHTQAARALHKAVAGLREKVGYGAFTRWVPFIHIGA